MRIHHISDSHGQHDKVTLPEADILIHSGDITSYGRLHEVKSFLDWFASQPHLWKIFIPGNHDRSFDPKYKDDYPQIKEILALIDNFVSKEGCIYLQDSSETINGIKIYGSGWTPWFFGDRWAFNKHRGEDITKIWDKIPIDTDILVTHGPPRGILDWVPNPDIRLGHNVGCIDLDSMVSKIKPRLHLFGHLHAKGGSTLTKNGTIYSNGAVLDDSYTKFNDGNLIEL